MKTALLAVALSSATAQGYPSKPIRFVVPWSAGGSTDQVARILAQPLSQAMGEPVVVENKGGSADSFARFSLSEIKRYEGIVRDSGAPKE